MQGVIFQQRKHIWKLIDTLCNDIPDNERPLPGQAKRYLNPKANLV